MARMRERITAGMVNQITNLKILDKLRMYWGDPLVGDHFVKAGNDQVYVVEGDNRFDTEADDYQIYYLANNERIYVNHDKCLPVLSIAQILDILEHRESHLQIQQTAEGLWFVVTSEMFLGLEGEGLCDLLWKATLTSMQNI